MLRYEVCSPGVGSECEGCLRGIGVSALDLRRHNAEHVTGLSVSVQLSDEHAADLYVSGLPD